MRIRNRRVRLPLSALLPTPPSDLQIRSSIGFPVRVTDSRASGVQDFNISSGNDGESRKGAYSRRDEMGRGRRNFSLGGTMEEVYEEVLEGEATPGAGKSTKGKRIVEITRTANYAPGWIPSKEGSCCINGARTGGETRIDILGMPSRSLQGDETSIAPHSKGRRGTRVITRELVGSHGDGKVDGISNGKRLREGMFDQDDRENGEEGRVSGASKTPEKKTLKNSSAMRPLGGSRCSRMNGRGWRCCQQTLVGYSLCEHHLGKGSLRSMARVASRGEGDPRSNAAAPSSTLKIDSGGARDPTASKTMPTILKKKGERIGLVKARSLKTLLALTDTAPVTSMAENSETVSPFFNSPASSSYAC